MPLTGKPEKDIPKLIREGYPKGQAVAIAKAEEKKKKKAKK